MRFLSLVYPWFCLFYFCGSLYSNQFDEVILYPEQFQRAHIGISVVEVETGKEVFSKNAEQFLLPASLQKIPLSVAALTYLGQDFQFKTDLEYEGEITSEGVLRGNLWIRGGGDPTLSLTIFSEWEEALKKEGILSIQGKIFIDTSCFETVLASPYWIFQDLGNYYGAGAAALAINRNMYHLTFQPGAKEGDPATIIKIEPELPSLTINNEVTTGPAGSGDRVYIYGSEYSTLQFCRGTVPVDQPTLTVKGAMPDSVAFCAAELKSRFEPTEGVEVIAKKGLKGPTTLLHQHLSCSLQDLLKEMNHFSINIYSEHLLKAIGEGAAEKGAALVEKLLSSWGIPAQIKDGSGLARTNYFTPRGFTSLLLEIRKRALYQPVYLSFPEPGQEGTLQAFPPIERATLKAKTGSMGNIYNLGGYIILNSGQKSGKEYAFAVFCNNYQGPQKDIKAKISAFLNQLVEKLEAV
jgi:serine-type D-Ala-D-Ala carboxypeptidase/endopeptidase (penicillin-binding protein 4)